MFAEELLRKAEFPVFVRAMICSLVKATCIAPGVLRSTNWTGRP